MDIQLPGMDGIEALGILKSSDRTVAVPVVAVTAFAMGDDHERALAAGFDGYLEKPISLGLLRRKRLVPSDQRGVAMAERDVILVVDDLEQNLRLLDAVLSPRGYEVPHGGLR